MSEAPPVQRSVNSRSHTRSIAKIGLTIAITVVSGWVSIPLGPVPFTLQVFALAFAIVALSPKECIAAIGGYLVLGGVGLPVFAGMHGGIGVLAGPTGGYLWGFLAGALVALALRFAFARLQAMHSGALGTKAQGLSHDSVKRGLAIDVASCLAFMIVLYVCGWLQFMVVAGVGPQAAFIATVAPFVVFDVVKVLAAALCARAVRRSLIYY